MLLLVIMFEIVNILFLIIITVITMKAIIL